MKIFINWMTKLINYQLKDPMLKMRLYISFLLYKIIYKNNIKLSLYFI